MLDISSLYCLSSDVDYFLFFVVMAQWRDGVIAEEVV